MNGLIHGLACVAVCVLAIVPVLLWSHLDEKRIRRARAEQLAHRAAFDEHSKAVDLTRPRTVADEAAKYLAGREPRR
jgi:hypothetical protein